MSSTFINRNFWYLIVSFSTILLFLNSCALVEDEKITVSRDILEQYVGSYRQRPDSSIAKVTLEGNQLFISSCKLIELKNYPISPDILEQYMDSRRQGTDKKDINLRAKVTDEIKRSIAHATSNKKYPLYAKSETKFCTRTMFPARIEFFKNDKGEVTHYIVKKNLIDHIDQRHKKMTDEALDAELTEIGIKMRS